MFNGVFALLGRSLRIDVRSRWPYAIRFWLMVWIYGALCIVRAFEMHFGAPGLRFFQSIAYLDAACLTLVGIGFFSSVITEEKEEGSLGLILMAGVSPLGVLLGKSISGCWQAILLVAVQYPFMLLAITMGGVRQSQVSAVSIALMAYVVFLTGFGLFCSTIASNNRNAAKIMTVGLIGFALISIGSARLSSFLAGSLLRGRLGSSSGSFDLNYLVWETVDCISRTNIFLYMGEILTTTSDESVITVQVVSNVLAGLFWMGVGWLIFGRVNRTLETEATGRGWVARRRGFFQFPPGRAWGFPFLWKDFYFVAGGWRAVLIRTLYFLALAVAVFRLRSTTRESWIQNYLDWASLSIVLDASMVVSRSLREEVRSRTLPTLLVLPRSMMEFVYEKLGGALLVCLPGAIVVELILGCTKTGHDDFVYYTSNEHGYEWLLIAALLLVPQLSGLLSLYVRRGSVAISVMLSFVLFVALAIGLLSKFDVQLRQSYSSMGTLFLLSIAAACHMGIYKQIHRLAVQ